MAIFDHIYGVPGQGNLDQTRADPSRAGGDRHDRRPRPWAHILSRILVSERRSVPRTKGGKTADVPHEQRMVKGSGLIVSALENEGVDLIFGIPGEETLDFVGSKIKFVAARHEQTAVYMAAAHGRLTGRAGVCLATLGPGALNFCNGAANGHLGAWPVLSQKAIRTDRQAGFQKVDTVSVMKGSGQEQFKILR